MKVGLMLGYGLRLQKFRKNEMDVKFMDYPFKEKEETEKL